MESAKVNDTFDKSSSTSVGPKTDLSVDKCKYTQQSTELQDSNQETIPTILTLNVGGYHFTTTRSTLCRYPESMIAAMFSGRHHVLRDSNGCYFIDSDGENFRYILSYLRHGTLPPSNLYESVYKEALYYGIESLIDQLRVTASIAQLIVRESHLAQFPEYELFKAKVIKIAMDNAVVDKIGEVIIHAYRKVFVPNSKYFCTGHECIADTAHLSIGPWESKASEETLVSSLESDLQADGFKIKPHEQWKRCKYFSGQNCQRNTWKISILFD